MPDGTPLEKFYSNLIASGKVSANEIGSYDNFLSNIQDTTKLGGFYNSLINKAGFTPDEIGTKEGFKYSL